MKIKTRKIMVLAFVIILNIFSINFLYAQEYTIIQLTNNISTDSSPKIDNGQVVWSHWNGDGWDVYLYNGVSTIKLNNGLGSNYDCQIDNGKVVWRNYYAGNYSIFLYDGTNAINIRNGSNNKEWPQIHNGQVVWQEYGGRNWDIFLYNGITVTQLTNNMWIDNRRPQINNGEIVWQQYISKDFEILFYNGTNTIQLTNNNYDDVNSQIHNGQIVWQGWDGHDWEIFFYNGTNTIQLTNNNYDDTNPQIDNGQVAWRAFDGSSYQIFLYNGSNILKITDGVKTDTFYPYLNPQLHNGQVVWHGYDDHDYEIFLYNGSKVIQLTDNDYNDFDPQISNGQIVWWGYSNNNDEIFLATPIGWPFDKGNTSPAVSDLNGDKNLDILVGSRGRLYNLNNNGEELWSVNLGYNLLSPPTVADLNKDGNPEIIIEEAGGSNINGGSLYCLNKEGGIIWQYAFGTSTYSHFGYVSPIASDFENDGNLEVIAGMNDKNLYCFDKDGHLRWKFETDFPYLSSAAIADLDNDGRLEILVRSYDEGPNTMLHCIDKDGHQLWKYSTGTWGEIAHPVIADLNGDGIFEILVGSGNRFLYCIDNTGQLKWRYEADIDDYNISSPAIGDLNNNGNLEILFSAGNTCSVYCLDENGSLIWKLLNNKRYALVSLPTPAIADLDADGYLEVLVGTRDLRCIDRDGRLLWNYDVTPFGFGVESSLSIADLDSNGNLEIMFATEGGGGLYCLNKDGQTFVPQSTQGLIDHMPWPMFQHDLQRTGFYSRNKAPILNPIGNKEINEGEFLEFTISATDSDVNDTLTFSASNLPEGATFVATTKAFAWMPNYDQSGTYTDIKFTVSDGSLTDEEIITITVNNTNRGPIFNPIGNKSVNEGTLLQFTISAIDPDGNTVTYSAINPPVGATIDSQTGKFNWTPGYTQAGRYIVTFIASDGILSAGETITITVNNINGPPVFEPIGDKTINRLKLLKFYIRATDPDGDRITYGATNLPKGAYFNKWTGKFVWVPHIRQAGDFRVTFIAKDRYGHQSSETIIISVINRAPILYPIGDKTIQTRRPLIFKLHANDPDTIDRHSLNYYAEGLPQGGFLGKSGGVFIWVPKANQREVYRVRFYVKDPPGAIDEETITITVK